jgi:hypothetical protein
MDLAAYPACPLARPGARLPRHGRGTIRPRVCRQLRSWVSSARPEAGANNRAFSRWRTIEAGIRTGSVWPEIFPRVLAARSFDDESLVLMLRSFVEHADYLMKFHTHGNWLTMEANGLFTLALCSRNSKTPPAGVRRPPDRLLRELDAQVYPDGAQMELAPGYHAVALRNFLGPVRLIARTGFEPARRLRAQARENVRLSPPVHAARLPHATAQ